MSKRILALLCAVLVLADLARATWSIVVVNHRTGEVCVAAATCIGNFDLKPALCVIRVGEGGAGAQDKVSDQLIVHFGGQGRAAGPLPGAKR